MRFLATDSHTKLIAKPQLRGAEGVKLTLNLGDEIPLVQTVFGAPVAGGFASIPQSSFTYRNVGINLEITPRVTYEGDIRLELSVESSQLGPSISVGGQDAPTISTRKVMTTLRLREGESNLLAGLLRDDQRKQLTGFPGTDAHAHPALALRSEQRFDRAVRHRHAPDAAHRAHARVTAAGGAPVPYCWSGALCVLTDRDRFGERWIDRPVPAAAPQPRRTTGARGGRDA